MTVRQLIKKLEKTDLDLDVIVLIKGKPTEHPVLDVEEGEADDGQYIEDVVFILA